MTYSKEQLGLIKTFIDNEPLFALVKDALLDGLTRIGDLNLYTQKSNDELGEIVRARIAAVNDIEAKFTELARLTRSNPQPSSRNESR